MNINISKEQNKNVDKRFLKYNEFKKTIVFSDDMVTRSIMLASKKEIKIMFVQSLIDHSFLSKFVLEPLMSLEKKQKVSLSTLMNKILCFGAVKEVENNEMMLNQLLSGFALLFLEGEQKVLSVAVVGYEKRSITEPPTSAVLKGPREGFIEDYATNISMIRRRLKSKDLVVKMQKIGRVSQTDIAVLYLANIADQNIVEKIENKLKAIDIDGIVDSYYLQSFLENPNNKFFKQIGNSEKPDVVCAKLLEGRVAIVVDGSPIVLTLPYILLEDFQNADDYLTHPFRATFLRSLRMLGIFFAILLPGIYVAMQSFHYVIFPNNFLISLLNSIEQLSFPPLIEILLVLFLFEILNEASIRMPKYLGMALSIVGALILGDTAVKAGILSSPSVMMVAISGICLYTVPDQVSAASLLRIIFTVLGGIAGFYGIMLGLIFLGSYLVGLDNYGTPYLAPFAPYIRRDMKDAVVKQDLKKMKTRPKSIPNKNEVRMKYDNTDK